MMESCGDDEAVIWGHQGSGTDSPAVVPDAVWWVVMKLGILRVQYSLLMPTTTPAWSYWVYGVMCWIGLMILWASTRNLLDQRLVPFRVAVMNMDVFLQTFFGSFQRSIGYSRSLHANWIEFLKTFALSFYFRFLPHQMCSALQSLANLPLISSQ